MKHYIDPRDEGPCENCGGHGFGSVPVIVGLDELSERDVQCDHCAGTGRRAGKREPEVDLEAIEWAVREGRVRQAAEAVPALIAEALRLRADGVSLDAELDALLGENAALRERLAAAERDFDWLHENAAQVYWNIVGSADGDKVEVTVWQADTLAEPSVAPTLQEAVRTARTGGRDEAQQGAEAAVEIGPDEPPDPYGCRDE